MTDTRKHNSRYDVVVIGSGLGGLTCGAFLARSGRRVLVLEKHTKIGGYAHTFRRRDFVFESGIHSVPFSASGVLMHVLRLLGVDARVEPIELPYMYHYSTPDYSYTLPSRREDIVEQLKGDFPHEAENLDRMFADMAGLYRDFAQVTCTFEEYYEDESAELASRFHNLSIEGYISSYIEDHRLREIFYGMWPYGGMHPERAPSLFYIMMFAVHLFEGTHTLEGGFGTLAHALENLPAPGRR